MAPTQRGILLCCIASGFAGAFMIPWRLGATGEDIPHLVLALIVSAALFNSLGTVIGGGRFGKLNRTDLGVAAAFAILTLLGNLLSAGAAEDITGPMLAVLLRSQVLWVSLIAWAVLGERITRRFALGVVVAVVGLILMQAPSLDLPLGSTPGALLALGASVCFGCMVILARRYRRHIHPVPVNALRLWLAALAWLVHHGPPDPAALTPRVIALGSLAGLFGPTLSRGLTLYALRDVRAQTAALLALLTPLVALVLSWLILAEVPTPVQLVGGALMLGGIALPSLAGRRAS